MVIKKNETAQQERLSTAHHDFEKGLNKRAFFKVNNHSVGEDLVQDTFMNTWKYLIKGGKIDVMKAFLYHTLNNLIIDKYRKRKTISLDALVEDGFEPISNYSENILDILDGKNALLLIQRLPEKYQKIMRMKYIQSLTTKEMSLITGQSKNSITVQAYRGLEKLKLLYNHIG